MGLFKTSLVVFVFLFTVNSAYSYQINVPDEKKLELKGIVDSFKLLDNGDVYVRVTAHFLVNSSNIPEGGSIYLWLKPLEMLQSPPAENVDITICEFDEDDIIPLHYTECKNEVPFTIKESHHNRSDAQYTDYYIKINTSENLPPDIYVKANFILRNHILNIDDYYLLYISYPEKAQEAIHHVTFTPTAIPYKIPEKSDLTTVASKGEEEKPIFILHYKTRFEEGRNTDIIWYYDVEERKKKGIIRDVVFTIIGIIGGAIVGGAFSYWYAKKRAS